MWKPGTARPGYGAGEESGISSSKYKGGNTHKKKSAKSTKSGGGGSGVLGKRARSSKPPPRVHDDSVPDELAVDEQPARKRGRKELSSNVRGLKFMKQRAEAEAEAAAEQRRRAQVESTQWVIGDAAAAAGGAGGVGVSEGEGEAGNRGKLVCERFSADELERPRTGRLSFGGFRPELEAAVKAMRGEQRRQHANAKALAVEVSDDDMVERFGQYASVGANASGYKRQPKKQPKGSINSGAGVRQQGQWGGGGGKKRK